MARDHSNRALRGRRRECEALESVLEDARGGRSRVLVLRGEAGIGKHRALGDRRRLGVQYGALASVTSRHPWAREFALGPVAWISGYVVLPSANVYKPIWDYDARTLVEDLSAHLVYGAVTTATFAALTR